MLLRLNNPGHELRPPSEIFGRSRSRDGPLINHKREGPMSRRHLATGPPQGTGPPSGDDKGRKKRTLCFVEPRQGSFKEQQNIHQEENQVLRN
jgi:hypothetical protein